MQLPTTYTSRVCVQMQANELSSDMEATRGELAARQADLEAAQKKVRRFPTRCTACFTPCLRQPGLRERMRLPVR